MPLGPIRQRLLLLFRSRIGRLLMLELALKSM
jgi:hypothetical protein